MKENLKKYWYFSLILFLIPIYFAFNKNNDDDIIEENLIAIKDEVPEKEDIVVEEKY